jgi:hypothetical protein
MSKKLFDFFNEKFEANLKGSRPSAAFNKTTEEIGFEAYSSYESFSTCRKRARKNKRER